MVMIMMTMIAFIVMIVVSVTVIMMVTIMIIIIIIIMITMITIMLIPRKLHLSPQLGVVELELEFQDGSSRSFLASPVQVSAEDSVVANSCILLKCN